MKTNLKTDLKKISEMKLGSRSLESVDPGWKNNSFAELVFKLHTVDGWLISTSLGTDNPLNLLGEFGFLRKSTKKWTNPLILDSWIFLRIADFGV